ncbi:hypothetical protein E0W68_10595 [Flavobacterium salilacus subsp. salilacus]|uniref:hypothetical protein n=1 Tax=Flavobacterium TaxID=237 RepID=UPI0010758246|nr:MULTISPECIES: hypothetical protein [Flavobacterium]KAF2518177.1 hypothetical protein E0W68_10595 [Flavobacterium salilacus subsp. salilacus]MBE1615512.1 hypothetical protein [Flavobacterium sp. SaA2.13]
MRTKITLFMLFCIGIMYAQIPSIKENYESDISGFVSGDNKANIIGEDDETSFANSISLLYTDKSTIVQSELISDYMGRVRLSFGSVVTATSDNEETTSDQQETDTNKQELLRVANGGGNFYLMGQLPVYARKRDTWFMFPAFNAKISADIDGVGSNVNASDARGMLYASFYGSKASDNKKFNFFVNAEYGLMIVSDDFKDRFGIDSGFKKPILLGRAMFGVTISSTLRFTVITKAFSNYNQLVNDKIMVGFQFLSN